MEEGSGIGALMGLALAAALVEGAAMLPYLAATGLIGSAEVSWPQRLLLLAGYCLVMVLPALVLLALRRATRTTRVAFGPWMIVGAVLGIAAGRALW